MTQESLVFFIGFCLFLVPFLGVPADWKTIAYVVCAVLLMIIGYRLRYARYLRSIEDEHGERRTDSFVEATQSLFDSSEKKGP